MLLIYKKTIFVIMTLANYINDLLYRYDCVIVPNFGGFVTTKIGAKMNDATQTFYPPKKQITFNSYLQHNDGLLANHIASDQKISFEKATSFISDEVAKWKKNLETTVVKVASVGSLSLNDDKKIKELLKQTKAFTRDEFSKLLHTCHNIIRNNDKLSPEAAFDEISKILFVKIRYERDNSKTQIFSKNRFLEDKEAYDRHKSKDSRPFYQQLFESTKEDFKDDDLFSENETIRIRENSFEAIVEKLEKFSTDSGKPSIHFFGHTHGYSRGQSKDHKHLWVNVASAGGAIDNWGEFEGRDYDEFTVTQDEYGFVMVEVDGSQEDPKFTIKRPIELIVSPSGLDQTARTRCSRVRPLSQ